ncbi:MAG: bifunctional precorrin-2 dehydrogenase/sirohydrochlorin ferrochelatase [Bacillota bacterium]|nr:bifunctional precorrin-2 dehydrogenase/sirohydrochlorin ferrochelatase [Bacillota bacterium]
MAAHDHFPMFIKTEGRRVLVIGGGSVAERRIKTLTEFNFDITVLSDMITDEIKKLHECGRIEYIPGTFEPLKPEEDAAYLSDVYMVLACTNYRAVNAKIGEVCRQRGIHVNVCDSREESTFWFPAVATNDELVMGLTGNGNSHSTVRKAAAKLRSIIKERQY